MLAKEEQMPRPASGLFSLFFSVNFWRPYFSSSDLVQPWMIEQEHAFSVWNEVLRTSHLFDFQSLFSCDFVVVFIQYSFVFNADFSEFALRYNDCFEQVVVCYLIGVMLNLVYSRTWIGFVGVQIDELPWLFRVVPDLFQIYSFHLTDRGFESLGEKRRQDRMTPPSFLNRFVMPTGDQGVRHINVRAVSCFLL